jgi:hypothetical protein
MENFNFNFDAMKEALKDDFNVIDVVEMEKTIVSFECAQSGMITGFNKVQGAGGVDGLDLKMAKTILSLLTDCADVYYKLAAKNPGMEEARVPMIGCEEMSLGDFVDLIQTTIVELERTCA